MPQPSPGTGPLYSIEDICSIFSIKPDTYYKYVREGRFPRPRWMVGEWRYTQSDLDAVVLFAGRWEPGPFDPENTPAKKSKRPDDEEKS